MSRAAEIIREAGEQPDPAAWLRGRGLCLAPVRATWEMGRVAAVAAGVASPQRGQQAYAAALAAWEGPNK